MRSHYKLIQTRNFQRIAALTVVTFSFFCSGSALAIKAGHGRVSSAPGQALEVSLPLQGLNVQDQQVLQVRIALPEQWTKAGLTPPVPLNTLSVKVLPGSSSDSRTLLISSMQAAMRSPVDVLLEVTTASGSSNIQSSYLVLLPAEQVSSRDIRSSVSSFRVSHGDTLFGIAQRHAVAGTDLYQMLTALYEANPQAFIAGNMNLLRAGAVLKIPDADTVRAIDAKHARSTYQKHLNAFNQRRSSAVGRQAPALAAGAVQSGSVTPAAVSPEPSEKSDQLRLSSGNTADSRADAKVSATKEIEELQSRINALQQNVQQLKESIGDQSSTPASLPAVGVNPNAVSSSSASSSSGLAQTSTVTTAAASAAQDASKSEQIAEQTSNSAISLNSWDGVSAFLAKNILASLTALIALSALIIAWLLRRAGVRRDEDADEFDSGSPLNTAVQSAFNQKLQAISLDLDDAPVANHKNDPSLNKSV